MKAKKCHYKINKSSCPDDFLSHQVDFFLSHQEDILCHQDNFLAATMQL